MCHTPQAWLLIGPLLVCAPDAAMAQAQPRDPLHGGVVDLRLVTVTVPSSAGWTPALAAGAVLPGRGFGAEAGAHLLWGPGRFRRLGAGVSGLVAQGRATGPSPAPTVTTRLLAAAPHVSVNFGHAQGWSYLSLGAGLAKVTSEAAGVAATPADWGLVFHYGGGARWFLRERIALSLDLRFWALTPRAATAMRPRAAATTRIALGAGLSFH